MKAMVWSVSSVGYLVVLTPPRFQFNPTWATVPSLKKMGRGEINKQRL